MNRQSPAGGAPQSSTDNATEGPPAAVFCHPLSPRARLSLQVARCCWLGMVALLSLSSFLLIPAGVHPLLPLLVQLAPWLACGPGLLRGWPRTHILVCFLSLVWFIQGVLLVIQPARIAWGILEISLCLGLFWSTVLYVRWHREATRMSTN